MARSSSETKGPLSESKSLRSSPRWAWDSPVCKVPLLDSSLRRLPLRPLPHIRALLVNNRRGGVIGFLVFPGYVAGESKALDHQEMLTVN